MRRSLTFALALFGLFDSLYLFWVYVAPSHPIVCLGSGCDQVRASRFAHIAGLPTPVFGVIMYGALALLLFTEPLFSNAMGVQWRRAIALIAGIGVAASAVLTAIEAWVIHAWCAWCVAQAIAITLIFVLSLSLLGSRFDDHAQARSATWRHILVLALAVVVGARGFTWLEQHAEQSVQAAAPAPGDIAQRLVRPDSHVTGNADAAVTLVEFGDLQCPSCAAAAPEIKQLRRLYADRVRFVFRQFPLEQVHEYALHAAEASECSAQQGKFWQAVDRFYDANGELNDASLERYAGEIGLDTSKFLACLSGEATRVVVQRDREDGLALGVRATPTFFLGTQRIVGAPELSKFKQMIDRELAAKGAQAAVETAKAGSRAQAAPPRQQLASTGGVGFGGGSNGGFLDIKGNSTDCTVDAPKGPEPQMIHTPEAEKLYHDGAVLVDVRSPEEFRAAHIQGAVNIPLLEAERRAGELPRDKTVVLYESGSGGNADTCAASRSVGRLLFGRGFQKVLVYQDGLAGWQKQSLPISH